MNKMKTRFFTNISHEFRTPLTLIISPLESLLSDINIKPVIKQQLNLIQKNARRLLRLINQLLDISQIESDHLKLKVSQGDIVNYIQEIVTLFRWPAVQRNIQYQFTSDKDSYFAFFDNDKVEKICYNLIANAFKYTPDEGRIEVEITIGDENNNNLNGYLKLIVGDSGVGIRKEEQEKIFEHFYRSEITKNLEESGFGIGLAIVKGLVDAYRGKIEINSEEGSGTKFIIHLPIEREFFRDQEVDTKVKEEKSVTLDIYDLEQGLMESSQAHIVEEKPLAEQKSEKSVILLVEDDQELRAHLKNKFSTYAILEAENGQQAFEVTNEHHPDLIISDIRMPVMDGLELCKKIKTDENTSHIPIILLTAKVSEVDKFEGLNIGADAYITKPFDVKILLATTRNLIESRKQLKEKYSKSIVVEPTDISITSVDEKFLKRSIAIVEEHIADPDYSVDLFSKEVGMSRSHLHRKFVGLAGLSPSGFIRTLRMKRAAQLLTKGQLTVSEILFEVGIKSRSYFTKSFKEQFGVSPTEFTDINSQNHSIQDIG